MSCLSVAGIGDVCFWPLQDMAKINFNEFRLRGRVSYFTLGGGFRAAISRTALGQKRPPSSYFTDAPLLDPGPMSLRHILP